MSNHYTKQPDNRLATIKGNVAAIRRIAQELKIFPQGFELGCQERQPDCQESQSECSASFP